MVTYYNLTKYSDTSGIMGVFKTTSELTNYFFGYMIIMAVFVIPIWAMIQSGKDINSSVHYSALLSSVLSILFYISGIISSSIIIFIFVLVYIVTLIVKWYNS